MMKIVWSIICLQYFGSINKMNLKIENNVSFELVKKKNWAILVILQRIIVLFTQKIFTKLSRIWVWDLGSGKNLSRIRSSKRHRIIDPDPQHSWAPYEAGTAISHIDKPRLSHTGMVCYMVSCANLWKKIRVSLSSKSTNILDLVFVPDILCKI
jgi:hypothetical protein